MRLWRIPFIPFQKPNEEIPNVQIPENKNSETALRSGAFGNERARYERKCKQLKFCSGRDKRRVNKQELFIALPAEGNHYSLPF